MRRRISGVLDYAAPVLYGLRVWGAALNPRRRTEQPTYEPDLIA